jgi:hypothetical protein
LVSSRWSDIQSSVTDLAPGQEWNGTIELNEWTANARLPGLVSIDLQYWIEDPNGTIIVVRQSTSSGARLEFTYSAVSFASTQDGAPASFAQDILPLFRPVDIEHMRYEGLDLSDYESVRQDACGIVPAVISTSADFRMPPDYHWSDDYIDTFILWTDQGRLP